MPDRKSLISALWLASALTLLASVLVAPIRNSGSLTVRSRPDSLRRGIGPTSHLSHLLASKPVGRTAGQVPALDTEEEEKDDEQKTDWVQPGVRLRLCPPRSFAGIPLPSQVASYLTWTSFPLRC